MRNAVGRVAAGLGALVVVGLLVVLPAAPAAATGEGEVTGFTSTIDIRPDATLLVKEQIAWRFYSDGHGIYRRIPDVYPYDNTYDRVIDIHLVSVTSPTGAPTDVKQSEENGSFVLRIGDPNRLISGEQTYVITYEVAGALNAFESHDELYWNVTGSEWDGPIQQASARVRAPGEITAAACFAGPVESTLPCASSSVSPDKRRADFVAGTVVGQGSDFSVVVAVAKGAVTVPPPLLREKWSVGRAFQLTPVKGGLSALLLAAGLGGVGLLAYRRGRDRRYAGQVPGLAPAPGEPNVELREPLFSAEATSVEWTPPAGVRPGEVGTLMDEQANVVDVTATIIDLAVRGYLRIEEQERKHRFGSRDWLLVRVKPADADLMPYETRLYDGIFSGRDQVLLSDLKTHFAPDLSAVEKLLYQDLVKQGWYRFRPDLTRGAWRGLGLGTLVVALGVTYLLGRYTHWGLIGVSLVVAALALLLSARWMPARTGKGSAVLTKVLGFRRYISTAEASQIRYEEGVDVFSKYLPYAIVFGEADRWARVFQQLAASAGTAMVVPWYVGPQGWTFNDLGPSLASFATTSAGVMAATAASKGGSGFGGGGFSGGGFGGGGGGGW